MKKQYNNVIVTVIMVVGLIIAPVFITNANAPEQNLVNIGDKSLNAKVTGNDNHKVSVVFDSGYGDGIYTNSENADIETWKMIQDEISKYAKTLTYDRAGVGRSDFGVNRISLSQDEIDGFINGKELSYDPAVFESGAGKTAQDKARDLHALLEESNMPSPYLLVVHSLAIYDAVEFSKMYPNEVAGIVSVDGSDIHLIEDIVSWIRTCQPEIETPFLNQFTIADGTLSEVIQSELQIGNDCNALRHIPFTILYTAGEENGAEYEAMVDAAVKEWATWSDDAELVQVPKSGHYIMLDQPQCVIDAIKERLVQLDVTIN